MLKALRKEDPFAAEEILSELYFSIAPHAEEKPFELSPRRKQLRDEVKEEIFRKLDLRADDLSKGAIRKVNNFVSKELNRYALPISKIKRTKENLGQKGLLRPSLYKVDFTKTFRELYRPIGMRPEYAVTAIHQADKFQHIFPEQFGCDKSDSISLFLKYSKPEFCTLVFAVRDGAKQKVCHAWRIYGSDINFRTTNNALDVLRAFLDIYGVEFQLGAQKARFLLYEKIHFKSYNELRKILESQVKVKNHYVINFFLQENRDPPFLEVAVAFILDFNKYKSSFQSRRRRK